LQASTLGNDRAGRVNGEIRWLLDVESLTTCAFGNEDKRMVERIAAISSRGWLC